MSPQIVEGVRPALRPRGVRPSCYARVERVLGALGFVPPAIVVTLLFARVSGRGPARRRHQQRPEGRLDHRDHRRTSRARRRVMDRVPPPGPSGDSALCAGLDDPSCAIATLHRLWAGRERRGALHVDGTRTAGATDVGRWSWNFSNWICAYERLRARQAGRGTPLLASLADAGQPMLIVAVIGSSADASWSSTNASGSPPAATATWSGP